LAPGGFSSHFHALQLNIAQNKKRPDGVEAFFILRVRELTTDRSDD